MTASLTAYASAYTPLESLLLFQYLSAYGVEPDRKGVFSIISDLLLKNRQIRDAASFDSGRLSADALREFYLRLLRDELKRESRDVNGTENVLTNGSVSPSSRKRKAPSPNLPTVQEASQHKHLIPHLITKLYARYREQIIREIRAEEREYERLQKEIDEIERGDWDRRLEQEIGSGKWSQLLNGAEIVAERDAAPSQQPTPIKTISAPTKSIVASPQGQSPAIRRPSIPPQSPQARESPVPQSPSHLQQPTKHAQDVQRPPSHLAGPGSQVPSPTPHQSPYPPPQLRPAPSPSASPDPRNASASGRQPASPVLLPPPPGMQIPPPHTNQQYRSPLAGSPVAQLPGPHSFPPHPPHQGGPGYPPQAYPMPQAPHPRNQHPHAGSPPMYPGGAYPPPPYPAPSPGGYMLPPFQVNLQQEPVSAPQQQPTQTAPPERPSQSQLGRPAPSFLSSGPALSDLTRLLSRRQLANPSAIRQYKQLSDSRWHGAIRHRAASPERPPASPISERAPSPMEDIQSSRSHALKRKRSASEASESIDLVPEAEAEAEPISPPQHVLATRNFQRTCNAMMNDVLSHKHASLFSNPVREKDAEGYHSIIRRAQDLKSIKASIAAGARAVNAASAADSTSNPGPNSPGGAGSNVILPISADLVPPKAIVNSAQLERELMRIFANAVMFNTGEEGVVRDAREMFEAVQESVSNWRGAERTTAASASGVGLGIGSRTGKVDDDGEADELAGEDEGGMTAKRRKGG